MDGRGRLLDLLTPVTVLPLPQTAPGTDAHPPHPVRGTDWESLQGVDADSSNHTLGLLGHGKLQLVPALDDDPVSYLRSVGGKYYY